MEYLVIIKNVFKDFFSYQNRVNQERLDSKENVDQRVYMDHQETVDHLDLLEMKESEDKEEH